MRNLKMLRKNEVKYLYNQFIQGDKRGKRYRKINEKCTQELSLILKSINSDISLI